MQQMPSSVVELSPNEPLVFYESHLEHYRKWARLHRYGYWFFIWLSIVTGIALGFSMLLKVDTFYVAAFALSLNAILVVNQAIRCDRKYPRYRMMEIRLTFALEAFRHRIARNIGQGKAFQEAMLQTVEEFHDKIESLVLEEFGDFFRDMTTLDELHKQISARSEPRH
jgi:hypothetical protein